MHQGKNKGGRPPLSGANQKAVLECVGDFPDAPSGFYAARTRLPRKEVNRVLKDLFSRGLLERTYLSGDRRRWVYRRAEGD